MVKEKMFDFCTSCRKETSYKICKKTVQKVIKGKSYEFEIAVAFCNECGKEMDIPSLLDSNVKSIDEQYRQIEGLISVDDIQKIMDIYNIGKEPLSIALGVGETTITRYLSGQMPSKEHSNILLRILSDKEYFSDLMSRKEKCPVENCSNCKYYFYDYSTGASECGQEDNMTEEEIDKYFIEGRNKCPFYVENES